jgi:hypothetical protein
MQRNSRKEGPDVRQFRWSETRLDGTRLYHKKIIGTVEQYPEEDAARRSVVGLVSELNTDGRPTNSSTMTVAQLCDHFEQRELAKENSWRSHATKKIYKAYLTRWIRPHWKKYQLAEVRTIQVESLSPALALTIAAWFMHDSSAAIQTSKWRKIVTIVGLLVLSADVVLSAGYVFYEFSARIVKFSVFDACSSVGALLRLIGIVAAFLGNGLGGRLLILLGCFSGMLFWYLTIGPHT